MPRALSIIRDHFRTMSLSQFAAFLWGALFKRERVLIYSIDLDRLDLSADSEQARHRIVKGSLKELENVRSRSDAVPWELRCDLYDGVSDFFVYRDPEGGAFGHISWVYHKGDPNRTLRLADGECEIMFCLTLPEFRGLGLYPMALREIQQDLKRRGYRRCFICVEADNRASIRGIEKAGFAYAGRLTFRKFLGVQVSRRRDTKRLKAAA